MRKVILIIFFFISLFAFVIYNRNKVNDIIKSEEMTIYLYFDSYTRQFGYPKDKEEFKYFVEYYENVNGKESQLWEHDYNVLVKNDSVYVSIKSFYFFNEINVMKIKKVNRKPTVPLH